MEPRDEKFLKDHGITNWGTYDTFPIPFKEIPIEKFWKKFSIYGISDDNEFRQLSIDGIKRSVHIIIHHDKIFAIYVKTKDGVVTPICYLIGCDHSFEYTTIGRCLHRLTCRKCGYSYEEDSSG